MDREGKTCGVFEGVCVSAVDIGNKPILVTRKMGGKFEKKSRALGISNGLADQGEKKILQSEKGEKNKGKVEAGVCMCVSRALIVVFTVAWRTRTASGVPANALA